MAETHDTIDGLLAEFRGYAAFMPPSHHATMSWADFRKMLDRFEAAHKREKTEWVNANAGLAKLVDIEKVGNAAKLREALVYVKQWREDCISEEGADLVDDMIAVVNAALATPPRNCDRPECATSKAAQAVWRKEDGGRTAYHVWLLATATEKEGGNDGNE